MNKNVAAALFWIAFGLAFVLYSFQYEWGHITEPAAGFFPSIMGSLMVLCGFLVLISSLRKRRTEKPPERVFEGTTPQYLRAAGMVVFITAAYIGLLKYVGFLVASPFMVFCLGWAMGGRNWIANLLTSIGMSAAIYYTFWVIMRQPIPLGKLWGY